MYDDVGEGVAANCFGSGECKDSDDCDECKDRDDRDDPSSSTIIRPTDKPSSSSSSSNTSKKNTVFKAMDRIRRRMLRIVDATRFVKADRHNTTNST